MYSVQCTVYSVQCTVCSLNKFVIYFLPNVQYIVFILFSVLHIFVLILFLYIQVQLEDNGNILEVKVAHAGESGVSRLLTYRLLGRLLGRLLTSC